MGVRAVGDDDAVVAGPGLENSPGDDHPFLRLDVGGVQTHQVLDGDPVIGAELIQLPLHDVAAVRLQSLAARHGGDGATGGNEQDMLFLCAVHKKQGLLWIGYRGLAGTV